MKYRVNVFFMLTSAVFFCVKEMDCVVMSVVLSQWSHRAAHNYIDTFKSGSWQEFFVTLSVSFSLTQVSKSSAPNHLSSRIVSAVGAILVPQFRCSNWAQRGNRETAGPAWASATKIVPPVPILQANWPFCSSHRWWEGDFGVQPLLSLLCLDSWWSLRSLMPGKRSNCPPTGHSGANVL